METLSELQGVISPVGASGDLRRLISLLYVRRVEEFIANEYAKQRFRCPVHLSIGQEAIAVGVCDALNADDHVISTHRSHSHYLARGGNLTRMFGELLGKSIGCCLGRGGSMHLFDKSVNFDGSIPIVGSSLSIAVGVAFALKAKESSICVSFQGDASYESGQFYEALNFASTFDVPVLIVIEDNGFSTYSPIQDRQPKEFSLAEVASGFGVAYWQSNGDDLDLVHAVTSEAVAYVRTGHPAIVRFETFRRYEHCGPNIDDALGYRSRDEILSYSNRDPVKIAQQRRLGSDTTQVQLNEILSHIDRMIENVFQEALVAPDAFDFAASSFIRYKSGS